MVTLFETSEYQGAVRFNQERRERRPNMKSAVFRNEIGISNVATGPILIVITRSRGPEMSRATTEAWYNADRISRLQLVAAYFVLNGLVPLVASLAALGYVIGGKIAPPEREWVPSFLIMIATAAVSFYCAYLLWNRRKTGAYWAIGLTVLSLITWLTDPSHSLFVLIIDLVPVVLVVTSWGVLRSDKRTPNSTKPTT